MPRFCYVWVPMEVRGKDFGGAESQVEHESDVRVGSNVGIDR